MVKLIAEFCQNHNGSYQCLQEMIHQAAEAGATYGKIQTIFADDLTKRERFENGLMEDGKQIVIKRPYLPEYERLKKLEVTYENHLKFIEECQKFGLVPLTTCFTLGSILQLAALPWSSIKVASYDCASIPFLIKLAEHFDHLIISTGSTTDDEIEKTAQVLNDSCVNFTFLHCVTIYPTPLNAIHLNRMLYLKQFTASVGLSEHTFVEEDDIKADLAAIYSGAEYIERHFSILPPEETKDGPVSVNSQHVKEIVAFSNLSRDEQKRFLDQNVPEFKMMLGKEKRKLTEQELLNRDYYRGRFATHSDGNVTYNWE